MSLRELNTETRRRLRRHAFWLTAWCLLVGFAASVLLLRGFGLANPSLRYGLAAAALYAFGLVLGARVWLLHFSQSVLADRAGARALGHAPADEQRRLDAEARRATARRANEEGRWRWLDALDVFELGEAALLLVVPALLVALVAFLFSWAGAPLLLADGLAGILAEVAVQFVFGALIARRVLRPRDHGEALVSIVGRTWLIGVLMVLACSAFGFVLRWLVPGAVSLGDLWRWL